MFANSGGGLKILGGGAYIQRRTTNNEFGLELQDEGRLSIDGTLYVGNKTVIFNGCSFMASVDPVGGVRVITTKGDRFLLPHTGAYKLLATGDIRDESTGQVLREAAHEAVFDALTEQDVHAEAIEWPEGREMDGGSEQACAICMARPRGRALLLPCKHSQFCCACALTAKASAICPVCRRPVEQAIKIFG